MDYSVYAVVAALFTVLVIRLQRRSPKLPYPPGPKGLPLIGNIRDIPSRQEWLTYAKWSRDFGMVPCTRTDYNPQLTRRLASDVIHLNLAGTHLLVVNSYEAAFELFDKRSVIYSDRPHLYMLAEL